MIPKDCKRLAEVDFPIAEVSRHAAREKSIRHGHPSTLHLWWARRPLAAARAVIFSQMVDDPSAYVDVLRADPKLSWGTHGGRCIICIVQQVIDRGLAGCRWEEPDLVPGPGARTLWPF